MNIGEIKRWTGFSAPNPAMLRAMLAQEGYEVNHWHDRAGTFYGWRNNSEERVHWVVSGELEITIDVAGKFHRYILKAGDRDVIQPNVFHQARAIGAEDLVYLVGIKRKVEEIQIETPKPKAKKAAPNTKKAAPKAKKVTAKNTKPKTTKTTAKLKKTK